MIAERSRKCDLFLRRNTSGSKIASAELRQQLRGELLNST
jgi:hypothetical protein